MFGQFCAAQEGLIAGTGRRSAFARACGGSAARGGAKLGRIVIAAAMKAAIVTAASALIIVRFPVDAARRPLVRMTRDRGKSSRGLKNLKFGSMADMVEPTLLAAVAGPG